MEIKLEFKKVSVLPPAMAGDGDISDRLLLMLSDGDFCTGWFDCVQNFYTLDDEYERNDVVAWAELPCSASIKELLNGKR